MKYLLSGAMLLSTCLSSLALAGEAVNQTQAVSANPMVNIKVQRGDVKIDTWDKSEVQVQGTLDDLSEGLVFKVSGTRVTVEDKMPRSYGGNAEGSKLTIMLPVSSNIEASGVSSDYRVNAVTGNLSMENVSGDISLKAIKGGAEVRTISGDIDAKDVAQVMALSTVSGEIEINKSQGDLSLTTVSGEIEVDSQAKSIKLETVSGEVEVDAPMLSQLKANSVSGDIKLNVSAELNEAKMDSVSGDIKLMFAGVPDAEFRINGGPGGRITNKLTDDKPKREKYSRQESLTFVSGSGDGTIVLSTISGKLEIN